MSTTVCVPPIIAAFVGAENVLGPSRVWRPENPDQEELIELLKSRDELKIFFEKMAEGGVGHKELRYWVDWIANNLNKILNKEGFDIQLEDFKEGEFGIVSILDVLVEWMTKGKEDTILVGNVSFPAVKMDYSGEVDGKYMQLVEVFTSPHHPHPVGMLDTKSGDKVFMSVAGVSSAPEGFGLYHNLEEIRTSLQADWGEWAGMIFPMVDLNDKPDISWLLGMNTIDKHGNYAEISQALQQTKFKMNQFGARTKSSVAIGFSLSAMRDKPEPEWLTIDRPFYLWKERKGISFPIVGMYVDCADWKDPGNLADM